MKSETRRVRQKRVRKGKFYQRIDINVDKAGVKGSSKNLINNQEHVNDLSVGSVDEKPPSITRKDLKSRATKK